MTYDELLAYALSLPGAWRDEPWDGDTVAKVGEKVFAFLGSDDGSVASVGVKCGTRTEADEFPDDASVAAYIGRHGWNVLKVGGAIPDVQVLKAVRSSYEQVVAKLPTSQRP